MNVRVELVRRLLEKASALAWKGVLSRGWRDCFDVFEAIVETAAGPLVVQVSNEDAHSAIVEVFRSIPGEVGRERIFRVVPTDRMPESVRFDLYELHRRVMNQVRQPEAESGIECLLEALSDGVPLATVPKATPDE